MVDHLRDERVRVAEQHQFLSRVLQVSPSGIVDPRLRRPHQQPQSRGRAPARRRRRRRRSGAGSRRSPRRSARPSRELAPGDARLVGMLGARRVKCHHGTFIDRGFPRSFLLIEELTEELRQFERAAYEKLIRVMSHEVNNTVAASNSLLHSSLAYAGELGAGQPPRLRAGDRHRHRAHRAAGQLHAALRRRLPPAAAADQAARPRADPAGHRRGCSRRTTTHGGSPGTGSCRRRRCGPTSTAASSSRRWSTS